MAEIFVGSDTDGCSLEIKTSQELRAVTLGILALSTELDAGSKLIIPIPHGDIKVKQNRRIVKNIARETSSTFQRHNSGSFIVSPDIAPALTHSNSKISLTIPQNKFVYFKIGLGLHQRQEMIKMVDDSIFLNDPVNETKYDLHHRFGVGYLGVIRELIGLIDPLKGSYAYTGHNPNKSLELHLDELIDAQE